MNIKVKLQAQASTMTVPGCDLINSVNANCMWKVCYQALYKRVFQAETSLRAQWSFTRTAVAEWKHSHFGFLKWIKWNKQLVDISIRLDDKSFFYKQQLFYKQQIFSEPSIIYYILTLVCSLQQLFKISPNILFNLYYNFDVFQLNHLGMYCTSLCVCTLFTINVWLTSCLSLCETSSL